MKNIPEKRQCVKNKLCSQGVRRPNWLFSGLDADGETLARAMTVIETLTINGLDPQAYLTDIKDRIHADKAGSTNSYPRIGSLLVKTYKRGTLPKNNKAAQIGRLRYK